MSSQIKGLKSIRTITDITSPVSDTEYPKIAKSNITIPLTPADIINIFIVNKIPVARLTIEYIKQLRHININVSPIGYRNGEWIYGINEIPFKKIN